MQKGTFPLTTSSRVTYMRLVVLGFFFLRFSLLTGAQDECPLQLDHHRVVVRYGSSVEVNCKTSVLHKGMGWEASEGAVPKTSDSLITWRVLNLTEWDMNVHCYINPNDRKQCLFNLTVTVYKTPDSVSISTVNHRGPMIEGQQYELQCDVHDVAPVQYLTVKWYKNQTLINETTFSDTDKTPVNKTVTLLIRPNGTDDGAQYRCEAELDLGAEGPQPHPKINSSEHLNVEVYYKPQHSSSTETIIKDDKVMLDCSVKANPAPDYTWSSDHLNLNISSSVIESSALSPGKYTCTATNSLGRDSKVFILKSTGAEAECPLQLNPQRVVVRYGGSVEVNCKTSVLHEGMGWEVSEGGVPKTSDSLITWRVSELTQWDIKPLCYINPNDSEQCQVELPVNFFKTPDSVSISTVNHRGPMKEGQQYELQCDVHDVAPVQNLTVKWYKGQTLLNETTFSDTDKKTPVNKTVTLLIRPNRADDGAKYWCEAELDLGAEGPQPPPKYSSELLNVEVYYKPRHSSSTETNIKDVKVMLNCTVKANPAPDYTWSSDDLKEKISSSVIESSELSPGNYTCNATNILGSDSKVFILKSKERTTFWAIVLTGVVVAVALIMAYLIFKFTFSKNSLI